MHSFVWRCSGVGGVVINHVIYEAVAKVGLYLRMEISQVMY